jgi:hypothetical protein
MAKDNMHPDWTPRIIATCAIVFAIGGGVAIVDKPSRDTNPAAAVTTNCRGFAGNARELNRGDDTATLRGTFAPGDHVHLAVDFKGVGYSWNLSGVLGVAKTDVTGSGVFQTNATSTETNTESDPPIHTTSVSFEAGAGTSGMIVSTRPEAHKYARSTTSGDVHGDISGLARLEVDVEVTAPGEGAITINETGSLPVALPPRVAAATCIAATKDDPLPGAAVSSNEPAAELSFAARVIWETPFAVRPQTAGFSGGATAKAAPSAIRTTEAAMIAVAGLVASASKPSPGGPMT